MPALILAALTWAVLGLLIFPPLADEFLHDKSLTDFHGWSIVAACGPFIWVAFAVTLICVALDEADKC